MIGSSGGDLPSCAEDHQRLRYPTSHLAITAVAPPKAPLPITETGYHSHFVEPGTIEQTGGPDLYVRAWLDEAAKSKAWRKAEEKRRQLDLFD